MNEFRSSMALLLLLTLSARASGDSSPAEFLKSCFKDYVLASTKKGQEFITGAEAVRKRCLSASFNRDWKKLTEKTDADAFLLAQDHQASWKENQEVKALSRDKEEATVILGKGEEQHCLRVTLSEKPPLRIEHIKNCQK